VLRDRPQRRPIRLPGYDYSRHGQYFVTIVTTKREEVLGEVLHGVMHLSAAGACVADVWASLPRHYSHVSLDAFVVMPNHVHGIVILGHDSAPGARRAPLSEVVRGFKTYAARGVNKLRGVSGTPVWQRNYYERSFGTNESS
jgi:REP element-mobilizing transposase RayT